MTPPDVQPRHWTLVEEVTRLYCDWLNSFNTTGDWVYTTDHFLDKSCNPYCDPEGMVRKLEEPIIPGEEATHLMLTMWDGDDGGPATLYVYAEPNWHYKDLNSEPKDYTVIYDGTYQIKFILQEFDTMFSHVYNGSVHPPALYTLETDTEAS